LNAFVPNAFTPNEDGLNDIFLPQFSAVPFVYDLKIFDRWGNKVFETNDPYKPWLGNVNGGDHYVEPGVYVWMMTVGRDDIDSKEIKGHVTVVR
jgi:gliding motility-associated-like protein